MGSFDSVLEELNLRHRKGIGCRHRPHLRHSLSAQCSWVAAVNKAEEHSEEHIEEHSGERAEERSEDDTKKRIQG